VKEKNRERAREINRIYLGATGAPNKQRHKANQKTERYKERKRKYNKRPEVKERTREYHKEYFKQPEVKERLQTTTRSCR
jgi:hypothetical protein